MRKCDHSCSGEPDRCGSFTSLSLYSLSLRIVHGWRPLLSSKLCDFAFAISAIQSSVTTEPRHAEYVCRRRNALTVFQVYNNVPFGTVRAEPLDGTESYEYDLSAGRFIVVNVDGRTEEVSREFPLSPPLLCLLNPICLPIWGGEYSFYSPRSAERTEDGDVRVSFGYQDELSANGSVVIDHESGAVTKLDLNGNTYERKLLR